LGLNGAGKSTTMNILTGCLSSTTGTVKINNIDMAEESEKVKQSIGYLPETPPLYLDMKVLEYMDFIYGIKKAGDRVAFSKNKQEKENLKTNHINEVCNKTGTDEIQNRLIKNLSKGYKQRLGLAAALIGNPDILVLDEPTAGLDPAQIIEIRNLIAEFGKSGTVIFSSHILSEVQTLCGRVIVLHNGCVAAELGQEELQESLEKTFMDLVKETEQ
jgi:ABC-2 type transport system ATP-binding protein